MSLMPDVAGSVGIGELGARRVAGGWRGGLGETRSYGVLRKGHLADCKLCICAAHAEKMCKDVLKREKLKGESGSRTGDCETTGLRDHGPQDEGGKAETLTR